MLDIVEMELRGTEGGLRWTQLDARPRNQKTLYGTQVASRITYRGCAPMHRAAAVQCWNDLEYMLLGWHG